jgi:DNA (cytosine-5)-methyltransferase 1
MLKVEHTSEVVSLFSGAGGMDLGFIQAGFRVIWANDNDHDCCETYRENIGDHIVFGDITKIDIKSIPSSDVIIGGPPCQGFSVAGKMDPNDPRSQLLWRFVSIVDVKRPKFFVMENVSSLGRISRWKVTRSKLMAEFRNIGYEVRFANLNSADYGVPQFRERVFFIGVEASLGIIPSFPASTHSNSWITARDALVRLTKPGEPGNEGECNAKIVLAPKPIMRRSPFAGMLFNGQGRLIDLNRPAPTLHASMGGNKTPIIDMRQLNDSNQEPWIVQYHQKLINGEIPGTFKPPDYLRRITVREAATLQTFPHEFMFHGTKCSQYRQVGNAVPPRLAYCIATAVPNLLNGESKPSIIGDERFQHSLF